MWPSRLRVKDHIDLSCSLFRILYLIFQVLLYQLQLRYKLRINLILLKELDITAVPAASGMPSAGTPLASAHPTSN